MIPAFLGRRLWFPDVTQADDEGLVAVGGDLNVERLLLAYSSGIFPWFIHEDLVYWFSPNPRMVLLPGDIKISTSMKRVLNQNRFQITFNKDFNAVINGCSNAPRKHQEGTWISDMFIAAYTKLHNEGYAHSIEVWQNEQLVGGLYGVILGKAFFGESMFSIMPNASKAAFISLAQKLFSEGYHFLDCQIHNPHLESLGAKEVSRNTFLAMLDKAIKM